MKKLTLSLIALSLLSQTMLADFICTQNEIASLTPSNRYVSVSSTGEYYDTKTITIDKKKKFISVWTIRALSSTARNYMAQISPKYANLGFYRNLEEIDYQNNTIHTNSNYPYNCDGTIIPTESTLNWPTDPIIPGSNAEALMENIKQKYNLK